MTTDAEQALVDAVQSVADALREIADCFKSNDVPGGGGLEVKVVNVLGEMIVEGIKVRIDQPDLPSMGPK